WKLELVTGSWNRTFAPRLDVFDAIHYLSPDLTQLHRGRRADVLPLKYERRFIQQLRHNGMDVLFCPSVPQLAELPLIYALNPGIYIGYEWELEHVEYSGIKHTQPFNSRHYEMDAIADFLPEFGLERNGVQLRYRPAQEGKLRVSAWLREQEVTDGYVVVFPGSGWPGKCWPTDRFATIVSHIANRGLKVILAGSAEEKVLCDEIRRLSGGKALVAAGVFSIDESAALIELSVLLLGNDSVPVHLAAAMGVPSVSLWGPTFVEKWGPRGEKHRCIKSVVLCHCIYWHPNATCERAGECMKAIQTREVIRALDEMLESRPDTSPACL
ncbi:MAG TPA: glycosyltransferase family 9 protein, partial [Kiritimatiellia bacterium]|nr:glycosyltransferase family 9 protein [Kiritimatiellia bacterium]